MISYHDSSHSDAYLRPTFSLVDRLRRYCWNIAWLLLCQWTPKPLHQWRVAILRLFGARMGRQNFVYPDCKIWGPWLLQTEDVVTIGPGVEIYNPGGVRLGHHSILSQDAYLCGATHNYNRSDFAYIKKEIVIEPYVWICAKAVILPGVHCREGSVLGATTVTSRDLSPWTVYAGNPARIVKKRHNFLKEPNAHYN